MPVFTDVGVGALARGLLPLDVLYHTKLFVASGVAESTAVIAP